MRFVRVYKEVDYSEESQDRACTFAFARKRRNGNVEILNQPVLCRDFLNDTLVWKAKETKYFGPIYGYGYRGYVDPKQVSLYMGDASYLTQNVPFLRKLEEEIGLKKKTTIHPVEGGPGEIYLTADKWWMTTTVHFSFYTWLLRQLTYQDVVEDWEDLVVTGPGAKLAPNTLKKLHLMLKELNVTTVSGTAPKWLDMGEDYHDTMHNYNGFTSQFTMRAYTQYGQQLNGLPTS